MLPSPLRPQTTKAIERVNTAASEAQPREINMAPSEQQSLSLYLGLGAVRTER